MINLNFVKSFERIYITIALKPIMKEINEQNLEIK